MSNYLYKISINDDPGQITAFFALTALLKALKKWDVPIFLTLLFYFSHFPALA